MISSAWEVVGPLAPSQRILQSTRAGVLGRDLVFGRRRNQNVAGMEQDVLRGHLFAAGREIRQRLALSVNPVDELRDVETFFVVQAAVNVGDADDFVAGLVHQHRRPAEPTLPKP